MNYVPSQDQVMAQLRVIIPALGSVVSAVGITNPQVGQWFQIALIAVGPISYLIVVVWSAIANTRASIMASAAKPAGPGIPPPQIVLPAQEAKLADALPANVNTTADVKVTPT
jgi:hypothetical protein